MYQPVGREHQAHSFADRAANMSFNNTHLHIPSQEEVGNEVYDLNTFQNSFDPYEPKRPIILTRVARQNSIGASTIASHPPAYSPLRSIIIPGLAICIPIALLSATLLALVFGYRVKSEESIFNDVSISDASRDPMYILVNYSATRLVFAASFLSTVAPLLTSFIMTLWGLVVAADMKMASTESHLNQLPTPYQLSMLVGLCLASIEQLRTYLFYCISRKRRTALPVILKQAALMFSLSIILAAAVFCADTALHYLTSTIEYDRISAVQHPVDEFGRGMSSMCLHMNRVADNYGFPCSMDIGSPNFTNPNDSASKIEVKKLQTNTSSSSQIRFSVDQKVNGADLALLLPPSSKLSDGTDFRTSTIGVSTQCQLINPSKCNMHAIGGNGTYTQFNCTENFYGLLGLSPNISASDGIKSDDVNLSPLAFKPAINLQWAFFKDPGLETLYNPADYDPATNQPLGNPPPDSDLINPFYLGLAARTSEASISVANTMLSDRRIFNIGHDYIEYLLSCNVSSYDVEYTWYHSKIQDVVYTRSANGTLLDIFQGAQTYIGATGGDYDFEQFLTEAAIAGDSLESYLNTLANLYSIKVLAGIGPYMSPRTNIREQLREQLLVAKVPKSALGALVGCSLAYIVFGIILLAAAYRASRHNVKVIAEQLSLAGLTNAAFGETKTPTSGTGDSSTPTSDEYTQRHHRETRRVRISGTEFRVWV